MATPYLQITVGDVPSTQDFARERLETIPTVVIANSQSHGRGRVGSQWINAQRALAVSYAWHVQADDHRPFSLLAGLAVTRAWSNGLTLKWPNDVYSQGRKVGGILVERSNEILVAGLGLNLYWPNAPDGMGALGDTDPGEDLHREIGAIWAAEFNTLLNDDGWPIDEYREVCSTLGKDIVWEPNGAGIAAGIADDGALLVKTATGIEAVHSGAVRHVRE